MSVLSTSAKGTSFLIIFQLASRGFTFLINQILLRYMSPEILGLSAQLDLYSRTVLSFSKDSIEVAAQRQPKNAQAVVNLAYLSIVFGGPLAYVLAALYLRTEIPHVPYFSQALWVYAISCVVELLAEPAFVAAQQRLLFRVRASAETIATISRCLLTCAVAVVATRLGSAPGVLPFAAGQFAFATMTLVVYAVKIWPVSKAEKFSLFPTYIQGSEYIRGFFSKSLCRLSASLLFQNLFKYVLTQGDGILIATLASLSDQGAYALASNYGGLIARMLFQPIEETSRTIFAQLCSTEDVNPLKEKEMSGKEIAPKTQPDNKVQSARELLQNVLKLYSIIGLVACTIGPSVAPILLRIVAGAQWADTQASPVLVTYCYYIPLLAINGVTEAFVAAVAPNPILHIQSGLMGLWFLLFSAATWFFMRVLDLGARGLVLANCVNMVLRICFNGWFFTSFFRENKQDFQWASIMPNSMSIASAIGAWSILHSGLNSSVPLQGHLQDIVFTSVITGVFGLSLLYSERSFLLPFMKPLLRR
ncbi:Rft-1-domain-containing protein [Microthyrium microscopicum]|uniref:Man(5)GlcNAc(2)-PP-dolichol translocation protein RFT1 n=1 Tax=Microthyrium microscopicum TaxID=703497 RepID=A0A6A6UJ21_9PEZI|nr:Rft-1-domain-containing protein [Microthyrium microscopicum]